MYLVIVGGKYSGPIFITSYVSHEKRYQGLSAYAYRTPEQGSLGMRLPMNSRNYVARYGHYPHTCVIHLWPQPPT